MNIAELLSHLRNEQLLDLSRVMGSGSRSPSARSLLQDLIRTYRDPKALDLALDVLEPDASEFLAILIRFVARDGTMFHLPPSLDESWGGDANVRRRVETLLSYGLLFHAPSLHTHGTRSGGSGHADEKSAGRHAYIIPSDLGDNLLQLFDRKFRRTIHRSSVSKPSEPTSHIPVPVRSLTYALLRLLVLAKRGKVKITNTGRASKRSVDAWSETLPPDSIPKSSPCGSQGENLHPNAKELFDFLLDFALEIDLARQHGGEVAVTKRAGQWLDHPDELLLNRLFSYYVRQRLYPSRIHQLAALMVLTCEDWNDCRQFVQLIVNRLDRMPPARETNENGSDASRLKSGDHTKPERDSRVGTVTRVLDETCSYLAMFGLLDLCQSPQQQVEPFIRRKTRAGDIELASRRDLELSKAQALREIEAVAIGQERAKISPGILQPTFELMVPPDTPLSSLWEIESFADFESADVMSKYRISRASFTRALREGMEPAEVRSKIAQYAPGPIPQNVAFSLEEWSQRYGQLEIRRGVLLRCQDPTLTRDIQLLPEIHHLIEEVISDTVVLIKEGREEELFELLEKYDYSAKYTRA